MLGRAVPTRVVQAECTAVEEHALGARATFAVLCTYVVGRDERDARLFTEGYAKYGGSIGAGTWPPPKIGDIGLWTLEATDEGVWYASNRFSFDIAWPVMASRKTEYANAKALVELSGTLPRVSGRTR